MQQNRVAIYEGMKKKILDECKSLLIHFASNMEVLIDLLSSYETRATAVDEVARACSTLGYLDKHELHFILSGHVQSIASFLPLNLPLYSLVLFAIVPSLMSDTVHVRSPVLMRPVVENLLNFLPKEFMPRIVIHDITRREFRERYVRHSQVVLFNGRYNNLKSVCSGLSSHQLIIYNGAGVNPFIIGDGANIEEAVEKSVAARLYNSGQDCAGPDVFFVKNTIWTSFVGKLIQRLKQVNTGDNKQIDVLVGPLVDVGSAADFEAYFSASKDAILFGGECDVPRNTVFPTIIERKLQECPKDFELFAPIFILTKYEDEHELLTFFDSLNYRDHAMYVSVFGESAIADVIKHHSQLLVNKNILDDEQGNHPFGGYGVKSSCVIRNGKKLARPILISKEIAEFISLRDNNSLPHSTHISCL